jgi:uncharacterized protein
VGWMFGVPPIWCCPVLALWLGACTVTVAPIKSGPDAKGGTDAVPSDVGPKCTGVGVFDADPSVSLTSGLVAYYPCEQAVETALPDLSGNNRNAQLASSATGDAGFRFAAGKVGKALYLSSASSAHVVLPSGMLTDACEATIATWVFLNSQKALQRAWTFSTGANAYMYLTTDHNLSSLMRAGITLKTNGDPEFVEGPGALPTGVWTHVAVVLGSAGLVLYIDGVQVGVNSASTIRPVDMGKTLYDYIGRSNYSWDPYLDGNIDEFRVYNRALSPAEIRALVL